MSQKSALACLLRDNRAHWPGLIWLVVLMLLSGVFKSYAAEYLGQAIDLGMNAQMDGMMHSILITLIMYLCDAVRLGVFNAETARTVERMFLGIKRQAFDAVARCKLSAFDSDMQGGDVLSRVTSDLPKLSQRFAESFTWLISVFSRGIIALVFCIGVSWELSAVYVIMIPVLLFLMNRIGKPIQELQKQASRSSGKAYGIMNEMLSNNTAIKAFGAEYRMDERFDSEVQAQRNRLDQAGRKGTILSLTAYLSDVILMAVLFLYGGWLIAAGRISVGAFVTFVTLSGSIREAFGLLDRGMSTMREAEALAGRLYEVLDLPREGGNDKSDAKLLTSSDEVISMRNLSFAYVPGKTVLNNINISVRRGQHVGIIGPSGCGKSTLVRLISGLYQGYQGEMDVFGISAAKIPLDELRGNIAMVSQNPYLFRGTIAENVLYGNVNADGAQLEQALRNARLWDYVSTLEDGINSQIGDGGSKLSGGQRQRIAIARALIRNAELIILDEASSALDTKTEREIQQTMDEVFRDKTVIVIAHRFTSIRSADYIYCMADSGIAGQGTMRELMAHDSMLRRMAEAQGGAADE